MIRTVVTALRWLTIGGAIYAVPVLRFLGLALTLAVTAAVRGTVAATPRVRAAAITALMPAAQVGRRLAIRYL